MTRGTSSPSRERSCARSSRSWPCTSAGWSRRSSWSTRCGATTRRRRCGTVCRGWRRSSDAALGSADLVVMRGDGYALELPPDAIDVGRFEQRAAEGRALAAAGALDRPSSCWPRPTPSGGAIPSPTSPTRTSRRGRSPGCRSRASRVIEERLDIELQLGRHQRVDRPARGARRRPSAARGVPRAADARALPRRAAGRRPPDLPGGPSAPGRGARPRTGTGAAPAGVGDPHPRPVAGAASRDRHRSTPPAPAARPGIPEALTPLVGRDAELRDLRALFADHRFVTLVGPGGVGKTRLALEVGRAVAEGLSFGGCLVELAPVGDPGRRSRGDRLRPRPAGPEPARRD